MEKEIKTNKPQKLGVVITSERENSCCGDYTQYKLSCWYDDEWKCADCFLNEIMSGDYFIYWEQNEDNEETKEDEEKRKFKNGELDYCEGCEKYIDQIDLGEGSFGCPICKSSNSITLCCNEDEEDEEFYESKQDAKETMESIDRENKLIEIKKLTIEQTDKILQKLRDYGLEIIDTEKGHKEQLDIFNIQVISEEYFNEKVNEALE